MSEFRSSAQYKQNRALNISGDVRSLVCFCVDTSGSMKEKLSLWGSKTKINLLSGVLKNIIMGFRNDPKMRHAVAISIVTYNKYAQCKEDFQDAVLYEDLEESCHFEDVTSSTNMTNGLNKSLESIRSIQRDLEDKDQNSYTPLLVFMTDGEPTNDDHWQKKFEDIRNMVSANKLHVFPIGIGKEADMDLISGLFPRGEIPRDFEAKYCMIKEENFVSVFDDVRRLVYEQNNGFVDEVRSMPVYADENTLNSQGGEDIASFLLEACIDI